MTRRPSTVNIQIHRFGSISCGSGDRGPDHLFQGKTGPPLLFLLTISPGVSTGRFVSGAYLVHWAENVGAASVGADGLPRPNVPEKSVEDHDEGCT